MTLKIRGSRGLFIHHPEDLKLAHGTFNFECIKSFRRRRELAVVSFMAIQRVCTLEIPYPG